MNSPSTGPKNGYHPFEYIVHFSSVMKALPSQRFHLDVAHAFIENRMKGVKDYIDAFGDRIAHVHLHDNHGKQDEHLSLGMGKIHLRVVSFLKEVNYDKR